MTDLDPSTGLPALPEGQFWRVRVDHTLSGGSLYVELREKRKHWFGSWKIAEYGPTYLDMCGTVENTIAYNARRVMEKSEHLRKQDSRLKIAESLAGDYPPKKLEG